MNWKEFEKASVKFLKENYGDCFYLQGASDSTVSDIFYDDGNKQFYIEAKDNPSQCGQFVLSPNKEKEIFEFSLRNKTIRNQYTDIIIKYMSEHYKEFVDVGVTGKDIELDKSIFYGWIIDYYINVKKAKYFITNLDDEFLIFPTEKFDKYFDVKGKYREKKSGSRPLNKSNILDLEKALSSKYINYRLHDLKIMSEENLANRKFKGDKYCYLLREAGPNYKVRILSNTKNANVIFSIKLKNNISKEVIKNNQIKFRERIK